MPNIKSAKKRVLQATKKQLRNQTRKSSFKTAIKKVIASLDSNNLEATKLLLIEAEGKIARAQDKGLLHRNTAARKISRLAKKVAAASRTV